jgi:lipoprotein-anchoring transpeptidase ErfK/SrfK
MLENQQGPHSSIAKCWFFTTLNFRIDGIVHLTVMNDSHKEKIPTMKTFARLFLIVPLSLVATLTSCSTKPPAPNPSQTKIPTAGIVNPHPPGSYAHFTYKPYPGTTKTWKNNSLLAKANSSNTSVRIDLSKQRGFLLVNGQIAMDYRISSGNSRHRTPAGSYRIIEKIRTKRSNLYGKVLNAEGKIVKTDADARKDAVPEGGSFLGASMPYWMRLTGNGIGMHQGNVNRRYASHGCIRTHYSAVPIVFAKTRVGTPVSVIN